MSNPKYIPRTFHRLNPAQLRDRDYFSNFSQKLMLMDFWRLDEIYDDCVAALKGTQEDTLRIRIERMAYKAMTTKWFRDNSWRE